MLSPELGRAVFRIAFYMVLTSAVLLLLLRPGSAEFIVAALALIIGLIFVGIIALIVRRQK